MKPEPRSMTLGDATAMSVGVAAAFGVMRLPGQIGFAPGAMTPTGALIFVELLIGWSVGMAMTFAILGRTFWYDRPPHPGEWIAILLGAVGLATMLPSLSYFFGLPFLQTLGIDVRKSQWLIASGWTGVLLVGLAMREAAGRSFPAGLRSMILIGLAVVAIGGPIATFRKEVPFLLIPPGPGGLTPSGMLVQQMSETVATTPLILMVALPTLRLATRWPGRASWTWTEWASPAFCLPIFGYVLYSRPSFFPPQSRPWVADQAFAVGWLAVVFALSWRLLTWWDRMHRVPSTISAQPASDPSIASPDSISAT